MWVWLSHVKIVKLRLSKPILSVFFTPSTTMNMGYGTLGETMSLTDKEITDRIGMYILEKNNIDADEEA